MAYIVFQQLYYTIGGSTDSQTIRAVIKMEMSLLNLLVFVVVLFIPNIYKAYKHEKRHEIRENRRRQ